MECDVYRSSGVASDTASYEPGNAKVSPWVDEDSTNTKYYHTDALGTTRMMTDDAGAQVEDTVYTAFGEKISGPNQRYGYAGAYGYQNHDEMPYQHVGARYYNPSSGRFLQRDPIGIFSGLNVYTYVYNSPLAWIDPSGLSAIAGALPIAGGVAVADGPLPIGDIVGVAIIVGALIYDFFTSSNVGPSGKPKIHKKSYPTKKRAKDAARQEGDGKPQHHGPHKPGQKPHYHPTGRDGNKLPHRPHYDHGAKC